MRKRRSVWILVAAAGVLLGVCSVSDAGERRALIYGIDKYRVRGTSALASAGGDTRLFLDLAGAVNDAKRIDTLLKSRFGFDASNVTMRLDGQATRERILADLDEMVEKTTPGQKDLLFFYFAGHGSQVANSLSRERDKLDESLVPADAASGARDVRDKEIRDRFNAILDRGGRVVAVYDSCHSGSISRGFAGEEMARVRRIAPDPRDVRDATVAPDPASRDALIFSAARDTQESYEDYDDNRLAGGIFTIALSRVLRTSPVDEPVQNVLRRVRALMQVSGKQQAPVLEGLEARKAESLFGLDASDAAAGRIVAAVRIAAGGAIVVEEGVAAGFTVGSELVKSRSSTPRLRITSVDDLSQSTAELVEGRLRDIADGDLYTVVSWAAPDVPALRVWMPRVDMTSAEVIRFASSLREMAQRRGFTWVTHPAETEPTHVVYVEEGKWKLSLPDGTVELGADPPTSQIESQLPSDGVKLYVNLPPPRDLQDSMELGDGTANSAVSWDARRDAHYVLAGRSSEDGALAYAWVRPGSFDVSGSTLPTATDWKRWTTPSETARELELLAVRLGRIRAWLTLEGPADTGQFRYQLSLERLKEGNEGSGDYLNNGSHGDEPHVVYKGERFQVVLVKGDPEGGVRRFVYVFGLDRNGASKLLFPRLADVEHQFPPVHDAAPKPVYELPGSRFTVSPPYGTDTFVLIASEESLPDATVLTQAGVRARSSTPGGTALQDLLANIGVRTRSQTLDPVTTHWSIQRLTVQALEASPPD